VEPGIEVAPGKGKEPEGPIEGTKTEGPEDEEEEPEEPTPPVRKPRRRKPAPEPGTPGETPGAEGTESSTEGSEAEEPGPGEELDDDKIQDISDSIKDIVTSIEKRESKKQPSDKADTKGSRARTYCSVCHSIIATIHHGCGAHLCSRCVIDFNKDRRAEKNLCPKCMKPIETAAPPSGSRAGWRDSL
jgi:hypothetical protein